MLELGLLTQDVILHRFHEPTVGALKVSSEIIRSEAFFHAFSQGC